MSNSPITRLWQSDHALMALGFVLPLASVGAALFTQHSLGMQPCPWCVLQRLIFVLIAGVAMLMLSLRQLPGLIGRLLQALGAIKAVLLSLAGMAAALWQHFVAAASASCNLTVADRIMNATGLDAAWPQVFEARASCADAATRLLGVPYEFWSLTLFALLAVLFARLIVRRG